MDDATWLRAWCARHPLQDPPVDAVRFTQAVMASVRAPSEPVQQRVSAQPWQWSWPSVSIGLAGAVAAFLLLVTHRQEPLPELALRGQPPAATRSLVDRQPPAVPQMTPHQPATPSLEDTMALLDALDEALVDGMLWELADTTLLHEELEFLDSVLAAFPS